MENKIKSLIRDGEIIVTTREIIQEAVKQELSHLYKDNGEFDKNRYMSQREFESLCDEDIADISNSISDYLTGD